MIDYMGEINRAECLFLVSIGEFTVNRLRCVVQEGRTTGAPESIEVAGAEIKNVQPVLPYVDSAWELLFEKYVAYSVRNESYTRKDVDEVWEGYLLRRYSKSKFLDYVRSSTFASDEFPGKLHHYELVCTDQIIDVVTVQPPAILHIESTSGTG
jgi:hypothetical protein